MKIHIPKNRLHLHYGDLTDFQSINDVISAIPPNETYNLAAQSFVGASFEQPIATGEITGLGLTRVLDTLRMVSPDTRFYQASSSEMFGGSEKPLNEKSPFLHRSLSLCCKNVLFYLIYRFYG